MKRCLHTLVCLVAALHLVGGHWGIMQMVAWATMLRDYTVERGLMVGVKDTFDGEHPCDMCRTIATEMGQEEQKKLPLGKNLQEPVSKWFGMQDRIVLPGLKLNEQVAERRNDASRSHATCWEIRPAVPPPRALA